MNEFISDREGDELSAKLKSSFSNLDFDRPSPSRKSQMRRQSRIAAAGLAGVAILAVGSLVPGGSSKSWANEPTLLSTSDRQYIAEICGATGNSNQTSDSYIVEGSDPSSDATIVSTADLLKKSYILDFRGGYGFYLFENELNEGKSACTFTQREGKFEAIAVFGTTEFGDGSDVYSSIVETSAPVETWHGESIAILSGKLSATASTVELRSNDYPTWKPLIVGNQWSMLIPSNLKGTLVELDSSGKVVSEKPYALAK